MDFEVNFDVETFLSHVRYDLKYEFGATSGSQAVPFGEVLSANIEYFYTDENNYSHAHHSSVFFNSALVPSFDVINGTQNVVSFTSDPSASASPSISCTARVCSLHSGSGYKFDFGHDYSTGTICNILLPSAGTNAYIKNNDTSVPTYSGKIVSPNDIKYTTSPAVHSRENSAPYVPLDGDYSYNDIRALVVNEYNDENPSETISESDFPDFDEWETESGNYQPFSIDYDEILGERELESILDETRYILNTEPYENFTMPTVDIETIEASGPPLGVASAVGAVFDMSASMPPDLVAVWGSLAVFAVLFWWLTK